MLCGATPLGLALVELGDSEVFVDVSFIDLQDDLGILVHLLMGLSDDEGIFTLASEHKELNSLFFGPLKLTEVCYHQGALRQLRLGAEDLLCTLRVVEVVQVESDDVLVVIGSLVCFLGLTVIFLRFFGLGDQNQD